MSFDQLKEALLEAADAQSADVAAKFKKKADAEEHRIKERAKSIEQEIISQAKAEGERQARQHHQEHQLAAKAHVLTAKQKEMDTTQQAVVDELLKWSDKDASAMLTKLVERVRDEKGNVVAGAAHAKLLGSLLKGTDLTLTDETVADDGGFIVRTDDGEINLTISQLVRQLFTLQRAEIAQRLFS